MPECGRARTSLAFALFNDDSSVRLFKSREVLFWFHTWRIAGEEIDALGESLINRVRATYSEGAPPLDIHPGAVLWQRGPLRELFALCSIYEFDASIVDADAQWLIYLSHDGVVYAATARDDQLLAAVQEYRSYWNLTEGGKPKHFST
jgi:hypothetical protein